MASAVATQAAALMPAFLTGSVAVEMGPDVGFSERGLGVALACFFLLAAVTSPHAGSLTDRLGPTRSIRIASALSATSLLATGLLVRSWWALLATMAIGAVGLTISGPGTKVMVARGVPRDRHGIAFGVMAGAVPLSSLLAGAAVPAIALTAGWRWAYAAGAAVAASGWLLAPDVPKGPSPPSRRLRSSGVDYGPLLALGIAVALGSAAATSVASFFVPAASRIGIATGVAGALLAVSSGIVIVARIVAGAAIDRTARDPLAVVMTMMAASTAGYALAATSSQVLMPFGALFAMAVGWSWSGLVVHAVVRHYADAPGAANGIISGAQNVGGVVGPLTFGFLAGGVSYPAAFLLIAGCAAAASVAASAGRRRLVGHTSEPRPT
jgi:MFS family permease